jgi:PAS domain S-box-containing protein
MSLPASNSNLPSVASAAEKRRFALCKFFARCASLAVVFLGASVLAGWLFDIELLKRIHPAWATMKANSAFCFICAGLALWLLNLRPATALKLRFAQACALAVTVVGLLTLGEYLFGRDLGIDHLLFREHGAEPGSPTPGRMGVETALCFVFLGIALVILDVETSRGRWPSQHLVLASACVTLFGFVGNFYGVAAGYGIVSRGSVAFHTLVALFLLCLGILLARPERGVMVNLASDRIEGVLTRRLLPAALLLPVLLGWLSLMGEQAGLYGPAASSALFATSLLVVFGGFVSWTAQTLNRVDIARWRAVESNLQLAAVVESSDDAIVSKNLDGIITSWNQGAERIFGYTAAEIVGQPISILIPPGNENEESENLERLWLGERIEPYETVRRRKDGTLVDVSLTISPVKDSRGQIIGASKFARDITEQKRSEDRLRQSEEHFRVTLASIGDAVIVTDSRAHVTFMNPVAERLTGYTLQEARGVPLSKSFKIINELTRQPVEIPVNKVLQKGLVVGLANDTVLISKDGAERPILDSAAPIRNVSGELIGVVLVCRDVTEHRAAELTARRLAAIVESSDDAIIGKNLNGIITSWNQGAEKIFGYTAAEVVGRAISIVIPPDRSSEESEILERLRRGERTEHYETVRRRKDGTLLDVSLTVSPVKDSHGQIIGASKIARDITERKQAEEALGRSEAHKTAILQTALDAILTVDQAATIREWNRGAEKMFGYPKAEALGRKIDELIIPAEKSEYYHGALVEYLATGVGSLLGRPFELAVMRRDGTKFYSEFAITPNSPAEPTEYTCISRDITERKRAEEAVRESEARLAKANEELEMKVEQRTARLQETIAELEAFSYSLSHDMRAPLRAMRSFSQIVMAEYGEKLGAGGTDLLKRVTDAAGRLDRLIQDVLAFSQLSGQEIKLETLEVENLMRQVIHERPEFQPPKADIQIQSPLLPVKGHEALLTQCLTNFLDNAVKFVDRGKQPRLIVKSEALGDEVRLWFEDNGIGIAKDMQERLFGIFQQLHRPGTYPGTGIGLAIVRKAAERMKGSVGVESEPGTGSRFWLQLPRGG